MEHQYCYLLQEREFIKTNEDVYKIGRTKSLSRFNAYPKGSKIICLRSVNDCYKTERELKRKFKLYFTNEKNIGTEYFSGCLNDMVRLFNIICRYDSLKTYNFEKICKFKKYNYDLDNDSDDCNDIFRINDEIFVSIPNKPGKSVKLK